MKKALLALVVLFTFSTQADAQVKIVLPRQFKMMNEVDKYSLNTMTKDFLKLNGFDVFYEDEVSKDVVVNACNYLYGEYNDHNTMFKTALEFELKDCFGNVVFKSDEGVSREKDYRVSYREAFRKAFYSKLADLKKVTLTDSKTVRNTNAAAASVETIKTVQNTTKVGYRWIGRGIKTSLVDAQNAPYISLTQTSFDSMYIALKGNQTGLFYQKNGSWYFEYEKDNVLSIENIQIAE